VIIIPIIAGTALPPKKSKNHKKSNTNAPSFRIGMNAPDILANSASKAAIYIAIYPS